MNNEEKQLFFFDMVADTGIKSKLVSLNLLPR